LTDKLPDRVGTAYIKAVCLDWSSVLSGQTSGLGKAVRVDVCANDSPGTSLGSLYR
jgi:hypothetical protein